MRFLEREREVLERFLPGVDAQLAELSLEELEKPGGPGIELFRAAGGPGLLVPAQHGGMGATPLEGARIQRAVGSRSPSLAIATNMHHFSIATLVELDRESIGFEWLLLESVATENKLIASGFAEGRSGQDILDPTLTARVENGTYLLSGTKKPCSLSRSMDLLSATVLMPDENDGASRLAVAVVPATARGIEIVPFWGSWILAGAESDEVRLLDVPVEDKLIVRTEREQNELSEVEEKGLLWFELLVTASYIGAASAIVERLLAAGKGSPSARAEVAGELEGAMGAIENVARAMEEEEREPDLLQQSLFARYLAHGAIGRATRLGAELLGGIAFASSADVAYLLASSSALTLHPPPRTRGLPALDEALQGQPLVVQ